MTSRGAVLRYGVSTGADRVARRGRVVCRPGRVLDGGTAAWRAAGLPLATGREAMADTPNDCWRRPYDPYAAPDARERYLKWEIELVRQIEREGDVGFRLPAAVD